jgi:hypothetical protein
MKNPASYLRRTILSLLDGNVSYGGNAVDVVESGSGTEGVGYQIFIGEYSDADSSNKHVFGANATQVIEVVSEQADSTKKAVDAIGELVTALIHPTTQSNLLSSADFRVIVVGRPSIGHLVEDSGSGTKIVRLLLRYNLLITHN